MAITIIAGAPGSGKTSLAAALLCEIYRTQGETLQEETAAKIEAANEKRLNPLEIPQKPPIYADFDIEFLVGYEEYYKPYFINGFYLGLPNDKMQTQFVPPGSKIFLSEVQRYYDSRKKALPDHVSRFFEMHRHYGIDIYLDIQRAMLVDLNIKELCRRFIEIQSHQNITDENGRIFKTVWTYREFGSWIEYEQYLSSNAQTYITKTYTHNGNIFECFNSFSFYEEFFPPENGKFSYLEYKSRTASQDLDEATAAFYKISEPEIYRGKPKENKEKKQ